MIDLRPAPPPSPAKTRDFELTTIHRTKTTTTTTTNVDKTVQEPSLISDAQIQTSLQWNEKTGEAEEFVANALEVTHLEIPLEIFQEALFPDKWGILSLDAAAESLLLDEEFQRTVHYYLETLKEDKEEDNPIHPPGQDMEDYITNMFNMIATRCPDSNDVRPHHLRFVDIRQFAPTPEPHEPPGIAAVFSSNDPAVEYQYKDVAILMDDGSEFEEEDSSYKEHMNTLQSTHERPSSDSRQGSIVSPSSKLIPRSRVRSASPSREVVPGSPRHDKFERTSPSRPPKRARNASSYSPPGSEKSSGTPPPYSDRAEQSQRSPPSDYKRQGPKPPSELSRMALETISALGNRRHVLAITISELVVRFWYFDRAGTIRTPSLKLNEPSFVKALMRIAFADAAQLGLEETFLVSPRHDSLVGCNVVVQNTTFTIREKLHCAPELHGRGTAVYAAETIPSVGHKVDEAESELIPAEVVVKLSWQPINWDSEDALYRLAARYGVGGISRLYRSECLTRLSRGFRGLLVHASRYRDRELRAQILGPLAIPLARVRNVEMFKTAFKSLVKG